MDTLTAAALLTLEVEPASLLSLSASVAVEFGVEDDTGLAAKLLELLERLAAIGLIEATA